MSAGKEVDRQEYMIAKIESERQFDHTVTHAAYNYSVFEKKNYHLLVMVHNSNKKSNRWKDKSSSHII